MKVITTVDLEDMSGDMPEFHIEAGTVLELISTEDGHWICEYNDDSFPVDFDEGEVIGESWLDWSDMIYDDRS